MKLSWWKEIPFGSHRHQSQCKQICLQVVGVSSIFCFGNRIINDILLHVAGISHKLYWIQYFSSNLLVLKFSSAETENSLHELLKTQDAHEVSTLLMTLYFMWRHLFSVNGNTIYAHTQVNFMWSSFIWMTSIHNVSIVTKRNMIYPTIVMCFIIIRSDPFRPHHNTLDACEHTFGFYRGMKR